MLQAIDEFRVQTGRLTAQSQSITGRSPAQQKVAFHGRVYHNLRNDFLDANPHQIVQRGGDKRKLRRNQWGFNVTGPVFIPKVYDGRSKTFFTFSYEGMRESIGQFNMQTIPTTLERTGSWAHVVDGAGNPLPIFDPKTTFANPNYDPSSPVTRENLAYNRLQFPGNLIPVTDLDPVALAALQHYPQPNTNAGPFFQNNYFSVTPEVNSANGFILTVDHTFLDKHRVTVRTNRSTGLRGNAPLFLTIANPNNPPVDATERSLNVEHIYTASAANINTFRVQLNSQVAANNAGLDARGKPFPRYNIDGYANMGTFNPSGRDANNNFQVSNTFASRWKTHRLSMQAEITQNQINTYRPQVPEGLFSFNSGLTSLPGIVNTGHGFASFLLGLSNFAQQSVVTSPSYFRWWQHRFVFQDQWQVTPSLTITFGLNLESYTHRLEKYDRQSNISLTEINPENGRPGALVVANRGGYGRAFAPMWTRVEPQIGLAWSVLGDNNTVLRISADRRYPGPRQNNGQFGTQAFNGTPVWLSPNPQLEPAVVLSNGLPPNQFPDLRPEAANYTSAQIYNSASTQPTNQNFNVSLQRQLLPFLIATVEYNYQLGRNDFVGSNLINPNAVPLEALAFRDKLNDLEFNRSLRPFPQYQDFDVANYWPGGKHKQQNLRFRLEKRSSGGLALGFEYNYNRRFDNYSSPVQDYYDLRKAWSRSGFQNPQYVNINYIYELPIGPGKPFLNSSGWLKNLAGGWALSGVTEIWQGNPIRLIPQFNNTGGVIRNNALYVDVVPGADPHVDNPGPNRWFNPDAFAQPADFTPGNGPRIHPSLRNPGGWGTDLTLTKRMAIGADRTMEIMASAFNALNHANWNSPDNRIGPAMFNAGRIIGSSGGRIVQLGLRLNF